LGATDITDRLDDENEPQPDVCLFILPEAGGRSRTDPDGYHRGGPELVVEVSGSSVSRDLHLKKEAYRREGVPEYVVLVLEPREILWLTLRQGEYVRVPPGADSVYRSSVLPGLWLDEKALLAGNAAQALETQRLGLASREHAQFVEALAARMRSPAR
jgi:Uma2 family endonuclease